MSELVSKKWLTEARDTFRASKHPFDEKLVLALTELLERREADTKAAVENDQECPFCGEFHDRRVACMSYANRREANQIEEQPKYTARWVNVPCQICQKRYGSGGMVYKDKFGLRCVVDGCGWTKDNERKADRRDVPDMKA